MRMPITDVLQSAAVMLENLCLLAPPIRSVGRSCAVVASPWSCSLFDDDRIVKKRSEELAPGFSVTNR